MITTSTTLATTPRPETRPRAEQRPTALRLRAADGPADVAAWSRFVASAADATVFHDHDWCAAVAEVFGHRPMHVLADRGGEVIGLLPLMEVSSMLGGRMLVSVPYGTYGGILTADPVARRALADEAVRLVERCEARVLDLRSAHATVPEFECDDAYLGFVRTLPDAAADVPAMFPRKARAVARHARDRGGVTVRHDPALLGVVWQLYCRSMRRLGSINYPYAFFEVLQRRFGGRAWVTVAFSGERPVTGVFSLVFRETLLPYVMGTDERVTSDGAANWLYWCLMERAVTAGLQRFDFGRSRADNTGAVGFKKNQGFEPQPLGYQRYVPPGRRAPDLKPSNPRFALARRVWRRLPLVTTTALGGWLAKSIPG